MPMFHWNWWNRVSWVDVYPCHSWRWMERCQVCLFCSPFKGDVLNIKILSAFPDCLFNQPITNLKQQSLFTQFHLVARKWHASPLPTRFLLMCLCAGQSMWWNCSFSVTGCLFTGGWGQPLRVSGHSCHAQTLLSGHPPSQRQPSQRLVDHIWFGLYLWLKQKKFIQILKKTKNSIT